MGWLTVIKPGTQTLVQDRGRPGLAFYAIPRSGPLDPRSAELAHTLVGNDDDAPLLECHYSPPELRFDSAASICLTGADLRWRLDGKKVRRNETHAVQPGAVLSGETAAEGCRGYVAIAGLIDADRTWGSASCYPLAGFGGNEGRPLAAGDTITWREPEKLAAPIRFNTSTPLTTDHLQLTPGPEHDWLTEASRAALYKQPFEVTAQSNRMGARLAGPVLSTDGRALDASVPVLPGMVQLLPSGQCIVVLADGQTTGGYPRIGYVPGSSLGCFSQLPRGQRFLWV